MYHCVEVFGFEASRKWTDTPATERGLEETAANVKNVLAEWFCLDWFRGEIERVALAVDYETCDARTTSLRIIIFRTIKILIYTLFRNVYNIRLINNNNNNNCQSDNIRGENKGDMQHIVNIKKIH